MFGGGEGDVDKLIIDLVSWEPGSEVEIYTYKMLAEEAPGSTLKKRKNMDSVKRQLKLELDRECLNQLKKLWSGIARHLNRGKGLKRYVVLDKSVDTDYPQEESTLCRRRSLLGMDRGRPSEPIVPGTGRSLAFKGDLGSTLQHPLHSSLLLSFVLIYKLETKTE